MIQINEDKSIYITRGDAAAFSVNAVADNGEAYTFRAGDVVRLKVFEKKDYSDVKLIKDVIVKEECTEVNIKLDGEDTKLGKVISKPYEYSYEIELNPDTNPQTIVGYDENGHKILRLYPEGGDEVIV